MTVQPDPAHARTWPRLRRDRQVGMPLPFVLQRPLRDGNFGRFYLAELGSPVPGARRPLVVKVMLPGAAEPEFERFAAEIERLSRLDAPNLARPLAAGHRDGLLYYALARPPRHTLAEPAVELSLEQRASAVADAARGTAALHEAGLVHCDIRPHNVFLYDDGARLADLGLSYGLAEDAQDVRGPMGAIEFMSPEIARGGRPHPTADVWALGATLHQAVTGRSVYRDIPHESLETALRYLWTAFVYVDEGLPAPLVALLRACLDDDPSRRPTAGELAAHLDAATATL